MGSDALQMPLAAGWEAIDDPQGQRQASEAAEQEGTGTLGSAAAAATAATLASLRQRRLPEVVVPAGAAATKAGPAAKVATRGEAGEDPGRAKQIAEREALREARRAASRTASSLASPLASPLPSPAVSVPASPVPRRSRLSLGAQGPESSPRVRRPELW